VPSIGFVLRLRDSPSGALERRVEEGIAFTAVVPGDAHLRQIALIAIDRSDTLQFAALMVSSGMVSTIDKRYRFSNFVDIGDVGLAEIAAELPGRFRRSFGLGSIAAATWRETIAALKRLRPHNARELERLEQLVSRYSQIIGDTRYDNVAMEKDATGLALDIGGVGRSELTTWSPPAQPAPFLLGLERARLFEDSAIANDVQYFGNWRAIRRNVVGAIEFHGNRQVVTVINVNRTGVERSTGVDLVYYHHQHAAYTMVQYKRMRRAAAEGAYETAEYRPRSDRSLRRELRRMAALNRDVPRARRLAGFRLHQGAAFLKLCPPLHLDPTSADLIRGMYLPLEFFELLLGSDQARGRRGGVRITFQSAGRHLNNTQFIELVQSGWVGSHDLATQRIHRLIRGGIDAGRSVLLAWSRALYPPDDDRMSGAQGVTWEDEAIDADATDL
jgi:hypothetical protein